MMILQDERNDNTDDLENFAGTNQRRSWADYRFPVNVNATQHESIMQPVYDWNWLQ